MLPSAEDDDLLPPFVETCVFVRMLVSSDAMSSTSLLLARGTLISAKRILAPPPLVGPQLVLTALVLLGSKLPAAHTTLGIKYAFENAPPPEPADCAKARQGASVATAKASTSFFMIPLLLGERLGPEGSGERWYGAAKPGY